MVVLHTNLNSSDIKIRNILKTLIGTYIMNKRLKKQLQNTLVKAKTANQNNDAYAFLPDIIKTIEAIQDEVKSDSPDNIKIELYLRGFGRLVTEDYAFSESGLGQDLLDLSKMLRTIYKI